MNAHKDCRIGRLVSLALFAAGAASAQETKLDREAASNVEAQPSPVEEVIVTAQKREQRLADVPISMAVLSGRDLDQSSAQGMVEILNSVPGVSTSAAAQGGGALVTVRGAAPGFHLFAGSSPIGFYLDSVPFGMTRSALAPDANAYDLDHVEVLRGPQGTLYGVSAVNGVVRVLSKGANLDEFEMKARAGLSFTEGGGENYRGDMAVNIPIVEGKLAARAVVGYQSLSGWIDKPVANDVNDATIRTFRLKVGAQPTEALSLEAFAWLSRSDFGTPSISDDQGHRNSLIGEGIATDYDVLSLKAVYDFSGFSVTSMSGFLDYDDNSRLDQSSRVNRPNTVLETHTQSESFSQEVLVHSTHDGPWRWTFGGIYRDMEDRNWQYPPPNVAPIDYTDTSESYAVFGELTRAFFDERLELTVGLRYFEDDARYDEDSRLNGAPANLLITADGKFDAVTPRVVLTWHPRAQTTIYASYSEGFRSGASQTATVLIVAPFPPVKPDLLKNYELGAKGSAWDGRLQFDTALFFIDWEDVQQSASVPVSGGTTAPALINGDSASGIGFEFGVSAKVIDNLTLSANFSWNDLTMDGDVYNFLKKGDRLNLSPESTGSASANYRMSLGSSGYEGTLAASANYTSRMSRRALVGPNMIDFVGDNMLTGRTSFVVSSPDNWTATLFVDNVTNEDGAMYYWHFPVDYGARIRPRTTGLQIDYQF